jgi:hypothetical protein
MTRVLIKYVLIGLMVFLFFAGIGLTSSVGYAQGRHMGEWVLPEHYPEWFDGIGHIDRIASDEIVIDDSLHKMAFYARYATPTRKIATRGWFKVGSHVGFVTNAKKEIISLWLIEQAK